MVELVNSSKLDSLSKSDILTKAQKQYIRIAGIIGQPYYPKKDLKRVKPMSEEITKEVFDHLVDLAALALNEEQAEYLRRQLNNQLKAIHELGGIPIGEDVPISLHGVPYYESESAPPREDEWHKYEDAADILRQAPQLEDGYIVVPDIPHTELK